MIVLFLKVGVWSLLFDVTSDYIIMMYIVWFFSCIKHYSISIGEKHYHHNYLLRVYHSASVMWNKTAVLAAAHCVHIVHMKKLIDKTGVQILSSWSRSRQSGHNDRTKKTKKFIFCHFCVKQRAKFPASRPADHLTLERLNQDTARDKVLEFTKSQQTWDIKNSWLTTSDSRFLRGTIERRVQAALTQQKVHIQERRDRSVSQRHFM